MFHVRAALFYLISLPFFSGLVFNCSEEILLSTFFCELVIRVELQGSYLEKPYLTSGDFSTLISHIAQSFIQTQKN